MWVRPATSLFSGVDSGGFVASCFCAGRLFSCSNLASLLHTLCAQSFNLPRACPRLLLLRDLMS